MKTCKNKQCTQPNPQHHTKFNKRTGIADGLQPYCRTCQSQANSRNRKKRTITYTPHWRALRRLRYKVRTGKIIKPTHCQHPGCTSTTLKAFIEPPYEFATPQWYCQAHHPNRSGNPVDPEVIVDDDN